MLTLRLPQELEERLAIAAQRTHRPKSRLAREALAEYLEDLEDYLEAKQALEEVQRGEDSVVPAEEVWRELGLED